MICTYHTSYAGMCGKRCSGERCEKHFGLEQRKKIEHIGKYSGPSKFAKEVGLFIKEKKWTHK